MVWNNINKTCALIQGVLCVLLVVWLLNRNGEESPIDFGISLQTIIIALIAFTGITSFFHSFVYQGKDYEENVDQGKNRARWFEYGITATIMLWIIAVSTGVAMTDNAVLWLSVIVLSSLLCMFCGFLGDTYEPQKWLWTILGWVSILIGYGIIFWHFFRNIGIATEEGEGEGTIPSFVYGIVFGLFFMYMSFGLIHLYHTMKGKKDLSVNRRVETFYLWDSLGSKTLLVGLLFGGLAFRRPRNSDA
jgi:hypothetical protein